MKEQIKAYQDALKRNPADREAFEQLSNILKENRKWKALLGLSEAYPDLADWVGLVNSLAAGVADEESPEKKSSLMHVIGQILEVKLNRPDEAIKLYQKAVKTWNGRTESFDAARKIYRLQGNYKMVVRLLQLELQVAATAQRQASLFTELSLLCQNELASAETDPEKRQKLFENAALYEAKANEVLRAVEEAK